MLLVSAASSGEIAIKYGLGRLDLPEPPTRYVPSRLRSLGATPLAVERHAHARRRRSATASSRSLRPSARGASHRAGMPLLSADAGLRALRRRGRGSHLSESEVSDVVGFVLADGPGAGRAPPPRLDVGAARGVVQRRLARCGDRRAPLREQPQRPGELGARRGEPVLQTRGALRVGRGATSPSASSCLSRRERMFGARPSRRSSSSPKRRGPPSSASTRSSVHRSPTRRHCLLRAPVRPVATDSPSVRLPTAHPPATVLVTC